MGDTLHSLEVPEIEEDGYYFGIQYKFSRPGSGKEPVLSSAGFAGLGAGAYGDWVKFMDMHGGAGIGLNNRYANPYVSGSLGFSLPYSRKRFSYEKTNLSGDGPSEIGLYRFASAIWTGYEMGLESPFGNRESGVRLHYSMGHKWFHMLKKDDIADHGREIVMEGIEAQYKLGLSWTY